MTAKEQDLATELAIYNDIHIESANNQKKTIAYRGSDNPEFIGEDEKYEVLLEELIGKAREAHEERLSDDDGDRWQPKRFVIDLGGGGIGLKYRVIAVPKGNSDYTFTMRHIRQNLPTLDRFNMPRHWAPILTRQKADGLFILSGTFGQGKTTLASSTLITRAGIYGGFGRTVEDPVEYDLTGAYGDVRNPRRGYITQSTVESNYGDSLSMLGGGVPAISTCQLMIGEILDADAAAEALIASSNGMCVITTMQAQTPVDALKRLSAWATSRLAGQAERLLASSIRVITHQKLSWGPLSNNPETDHWSRGELKGSITYVPDNSAIKSAIEMKKWDEVKRNVELQDRQFKELNDAKQSVTQHLHKMDEGTIK